MYLNKNETTHLKKIVNYLDTSESKHYEESNRPKDHIYNSVIVVKKKFNHKVIKY